VLAKSKLRADADDRGGVEGAASDCWEIGVYKDVNQTGACFRRGGETAAMRASDDIGSGELIDVLASGFKARAGVGYCDAIAEPRAKLLTEGAERSDSRSRRLRDRLGYRGGSCA
jgi:hypothetical protein